MPATFRPSPESATVTKPTTTTNEISTIKSNCMKGGIKKRSRKSRKRIRSKKKNKMLPSRVARLLGSTASSVGAGQHLASTSALGNSSGADDDELCVLARRIGPKRTLCNIEAGQKMAPNSGNCFLKCGTSLMSGGASGQNRSLLTAGSVASNDVGSSTLPTSTSGSNRCVAIDCEMVGTGFGGSTNALGRCSIVNYNGDVLYDEYIKPDVPIVNYRTRWSGISVMHMESAVPFYEAKNAIQEMLKGKIVIGHDVRNDFSVLRFSHPPEDIRDTSRYSGLRYLAGEDGKKRSIGLRALVGRLLGKSIQTGSHCSVEDARAAMSLYRLVDKQWEEDATSLFPDQQFRSSLLDDHFWPDDL